MTPRRKWLFRMLALVFVPLLDIGALEAGLHLAGFGYRTGFFETVRIGQREFLVNNDNFSLRFFPPQLMRWPGPVMMEAKKPGDTYRIFILGESAARGELQPSYAASRYLEALLDERFPNTHFQVVNLGITAINSHVILPIARGCARAGGDLWILYMGNNEMVGPFGAATVFGRKAPPLAFVRLNLAIQTTRTGQLLAGLGARLKGKSTNASWGGMEMFLGNQLRADDPRKEVVYRNFQRNLNDIVRAGLDSGAKILLNTVAVNLKDCPPFASLSGSSLSAADRARFEQLLTEARRAEGEKNFAAAAEIFARAAKLDPLFADVQYRWGECLLALTNSAAARERFQNACDVDELAFRADSRINRAIQDTARQFASDRLTFFDAAAWLAADSSKPVCGTETFYDHVHFNFDGNFRLGRAWAEQVERMLPAEISRNGGARGWASRETCEQRLGLTDWFRCALAEAVMDRLHRPPLSSQSNNAQRLRAVSDEANALRRRMDPAAAQAAANTYIEAIRHWPSDPWLHENFAEFLRSERELKPAAAQWQQACELLPYDCTAHYEAGRLLSALDRWAEAEGELTKAVTLRPRLAEAWYELGHVQLATGKFERALYDYERAADLDPLAATYCAFAGQALSKLNRHAAAMGRYRQALHIQPDFWKAHFALADELAAANQIGDAKDEYAEVVRLNPGNALAHLDLGVMQARLGLFDDALQQFGEALRLEPGNQQAQEYFARAKDWKNRRH
jgi:tetratricopeptide (TPR) repeat protein